VAGAEEEFRGAVPDGDDDLCEKRKLSWQKQKRKRTKTHLITRVQALQRLLIQPSQSQISNLDLTLVGDEDVGGLQVSMNYPVVVEVADTVEELPQERLEDANGKLGAGRGVVVDDLLEGEKR
jgi:hypothetical protein